jgi:hypothetical protein
MVYKNKDVFAEKDAIEIANKTALYFEEEIARVIQKTYADRHWTPISTELRHYALDKITKIFFGKISELEQFEENNKCRYKAQDEIYPELKEDLKKWFY